MRRASSSRAVSAGVRVGLLACALAASLTLLGRAQGGGPAAAAPAVAAAAAACVPQPGADESWLSWPADRAEAIGKAMYARGRVGGFWDARGLKTERATNYKLAATWITPEVIRATARRQQLSQRLTDDQARQLVCQAEAAKDTVVMVEIDPREGSGVIPLDWMAFLQPKGNEEKAPDVRGMRGTHAPDLREVMALAGVLRRNYDYDRFWVSFPLRHQDGSLVLPAEAREAELVVRIYDREGRVSWPVPESIRAISAPLRR
jgi:hypothetical protein